MEIDFNGKTWDTTAFSETGQQQITVFTGVITEMREEKVELEKQTTAALKKADLEVAKIDALTRALNEKLAQILTMEIEVLEGGPQEIQDVVPKARRTRKGKTVQ